MQHKLIMLAGTSSGAGKSTLSEFLFDQFIRHSIPTRWLYEEDILHLDAFTPVVQAFQHGQGDAIEALLVATKQFVAENVNENVVIVTDSIFPCQTWLFAAGYSRARIAEFSIQLAQLLAPLQPLLIYLNSDVAVSLKRAVAQRGTLWLDELIITMQTYTYCQTHPVHDMEDVIAFFKAETQLTVELLADWNHTWLSLDTTTTSLDQIKLMLLQHLGLSEQPAAFVPLAHELHSYAGVYAPRDPAASALPLEIRLDAGGLVINTYWPNGCRLIPEGPTEFRLQSTNRRVAFETQPHVAPRSLTYTHSGQVHHYDKTNEL
jgi:hypothetical protein